MRLLGRISIIVSCIRKVFSDMRQLDLGQKPAYELLQLSHRLEKGLLINNPKPLWGWEKAYRIAALLTQKSDEDDYTSNTAAAVLSAFLNAKETSLFEEERAKVQLFKVQTHFTPVKYDNIGGVSIITNAGFSLEEQDVIVRLFDSRHSCREFSDKHVPNEVIKKAVQMASRCPSACNRQPYKVYVIEPSKLESKLGRKLMYNGDKTLIVSGDIRAFSPSEMLDWIVSPSIFAAYLTLSLHSLGIGSCVVRKDLVKSNDYNNAVKEITGMSESEQIILELFIGYYHDSYEAPVSHRVCVEDITKFI